jgi:hypothetical protein
MILPVQTRAGAWQPLTPRGVAAFAGAPLSRLLLVEVILAVATAAAVAWFLHADWFPTIREATRQLPAQGEIRGGRLQWTGDSPQVLAEGHFLAFTVDLDHGGSVRLPAHLLVEFGREDVRLFSLLGYAACPYPADWIVAFNRSELEPWWGAWEPVIAWIAAGVVVAVLMASWALLATLYASAVWLTGFFTNRKLNLRASWKIAGAALMPGALLMIAGIVCYGAGALDLVKLGAISGAHVVLGWIYVLASPLLAPRLSAVAATPYNPFAVPPGRTTPAAEIKKEGGPARPGA